MQFVSIREARVLIGWDPSFYSHKDDCRAFIGFAFCKKQATLDEAAERLSKLRAAV